MNESESIQPGLSRQQDFTVEEEHTADHVGSGTVRVLATPWMIAFIEITARTLLDAHLPEGYSSVGTRVDVRHLAPSTLGSTVTARVEIREVEGTRVRLAVEVREEGKQVGAGSHERYVVEVERFLKGLGSA